MQYMNLYTILMTPSVPLQLCGYVTSLCHCGSFGSIVLTRSDIYAKIKIPVGYSSSASPDILYLPSELGGGISKSKGKTVFRCTWPWNAVSKGRQLEMTVRQSAQCSPLRLVQTYISDHMPLETQRTC